MVRRSTVCVRRRLGVWRRRSGTGHTTHVCGTVVHIGVEAGRIGRVSLAVWVGVVGIRRGIVLVRSCGVICRKRKTVSIPREMKKPKFKESCAIRQLVWASLPAQPRKRVFERENGVKWEGKHERETYRRCRPLCVRTQQQKHRLGIDRGTGHRYVEETNSPRLQQQHLQLLLLRKRPPRRSWLKVEEGW